MDPSSDPILTVADVSRAFGGVHAVDHASFVVGAATVTGLIGPNGAGKSTMCNLIAGVLRPDGGSVQYHGQEIAGRHPYELARMGLLRTFQTSSEFGRLTVTENLLVAAGSRLGDSSGALCAAVGTGGLKRRQTSIVPVRYWKSLISSTLPINSPANSVAARNVWWRSCVPSWQALGYCCSMSLWLEYIPRWSKPWSLRSGACATTASRSCSWSTTST